MNATPEPSPSNRPLQDSDSNSANSQFAKQVAEKRAGQENSEPEETLWKGGYSPRAMLGMWLGVSIVSIAIFVVAAIYNLPTIPIAIGCVVGMWVIVGCIYAYRRLGFHYELTTQRFIHQVGLLSRRTDRVEVIDIDDVSFHQGPVQRLLGVGSIDITGSDRTHPQLIMRGIADVKRVASLIDDIRRKERKKRSLHIQSM